MGDWDRHEPTTLEDVKRAVQSASSEITEAIRQYSDLDPEEKVDWVKASIVYLKVFQEIRAVLRLIAFLLLMLIAVVVAGHFL